MLDSFASVRAGRYDLTYTDQEGNKQAFRRGVGADVLRRELPDLLHQATERKHNLILRPHPPPTFLQLDDLNAQTLRRVQPAAFLMLETSPGNFQAWLALTEPPDPAFARRVRRGAGADPTASGATRVAGSRNFKARYAPSFPLVQITYRADGHLITPLLLETLGLVAPPEPMAPRVSRPVRDPQARRAWPDYDRCLAGAPIKHDHSGPDISRTDFTWCLIALDWGWSPEQTALQLLQCSAKAKTEGSRYTARTVTRAEEALARRQSSPSGRQSSL